MTIIIAIIITIIIAIIITINMKTFLIKCSSSRSSVAIGSVSPSGRVLINNWRGIPQVTPVAIIVIMITISIAIVIIIIIVTIIIISNLKIMLTITISM